MEDVQGAPAPAADADLRGELQAARAENDLLLQQITRLCLFVEQHTGCDPIEVMHGRAVIPKRRPVAPSAPAAVSGTQKSGWLRGMLSRAGLVDEVGPTGGPPEGNGSHPYGSAAARDEGAMMQAAWRAAMKEGAGGDAYPTAAAAHHGPFGASSGASSFVPGASTPSIGPAGGGGGSLGDDEYDVGPPIAPVVVAGGSFEWRGDPERLDDLESKVRESRAVAEAALDGVGLTRLPSSPPMWEHLSRTLSSISLNGNALVELPSAFSRLQLLRKLRLEGNLLRAVPTPVLALTHLEELGLGCNQLTGCARHHAQRTPETPLRRASNPEMGTQTATRHHTPPRAPTRSESAAESRSELLRCLHVIPLCSLPERIGGLSALLELWLVSNEISYLPPSIGQLHRLRKLELSANSLHELPRSFGKLSALTHLWLSGNSLTVFPLQLCALDALELLDVHGNQVRMHAEGLRPPWNTIPHAAAPLLGCGAEGAGGAVLTSWLFEPTCGQLTNLPRAVGTMPSLKALLVGANPLTFPPAGLIAQGPQVRLSCLGGRALIHPPNEPPIPPPWIPPQYSLP